MHMPARAHDYAGLSGEIACPRIGSPPTVANATETQHFVVVSMTACVVTLQGLTAAPANLNGAGRIV